MRFIRILERILDGPHHHEQMPANSLRPGHLELSLSPTLLVSPSACVRYSTMHTWRAIENPLFCMTMRFCYDSSIVTLSTCSMPHLFTVNCHWHTRVRRIERERERATVNRSQIEGIFSVPFLAKMSKIQWQWKPLPAIVNTNIDCRQCRAPHTTVAFTQKRNFVADTTISH